MLLSFKIETLKNGVHKDLSNHTSFYYFVFLGFFFVCFFTSIVFDGLTSALASKGCYKLQSWICICNSQKKLIFTY